MIGNRERVIDELIKGIESGSPDAITPRVNSATVVRAPALGLDSSGVEAVRTLLSCDPIALSEAHCEVNQVRELSESRSIVEFALRGSYSTDAAHSIPVDVRVDHAWLIKEEAGLLSQISAYWCSNQLARQAGSRTTSAVEIMSGSSI